LDTIIPSSTLDLDAFYASVEQLRDPVPPRQRPALFCGRRGGAAALGVSQVSWVGVSSGMVGTAGRELWPH